MWRLRISAPSAEYFKRSRPHAFSPEAVPEVRSLQLHFLLLYAPDTSGQVARRRAAAVMYEEMEKKASGVDIPISFERMIPSGRDIVLHVGCRPCQNHQLLFGKRVLARARCLILELCDIHDMRCRRCVRTRRTRPDPGHTFYPRGLSFCLLGSTSGDTSLTNECFWSCHL
jgi:hypothetical protein